MSELEPNETRTSSLANFASRSFLGVEIIAYMVLGLLLGLTAFVGIGSAALSLYHTVLSSADGESIVDTVDHLLFVLMVVEILHTVRVSFREGTLVCEPFLVVGLIASIRRVLAITLESSQINAPSHWGADSWSLFSATMIELGVLAALILTMVSAIYVLRRSNARGKEGPD